MFYFSAYENEASQANIHSDHFGMKDGCGEKKGFNALRTLLRDC